MLARHYRFSHVDVKEMQLPVGRYDIALVIDNHMRVYPRIIAGFAYCISL